MSNMNASHWHVAAAGAVALQGSLFKDVFAEHALPRADECLRQRAHERIEDCARAAPAA